MIKHIVMWKLKPQASGRTGKENAEEVKRLLESLNGKIKGMISLEVGIDFSRTDNSSDIVLYSEFETRQALDAYQVHPDHEAMKPFIMSVREERRIVDYEN